MNFAATSADTIATANDLPVTVDSIKAVLKNYSRYLRRDFLAFLVKSTSKQIGIHTSRDDWRTRTGMYKYLMRSWNRISPLLEQRCAVSWYVRNFEILENVLNKRKFAMFIHSHWKEYGEHLEQLSTISFIQAHVKEIGDYLNPKIEGPPPSCLDEDQVFAQIVSGYKTKISANSAPLPQCYPTTKEQDTMSFEYEDTFGAPNFEYLDFEQEQLDFEEDLEFDPILSL